MKNAFRIGGRTTTALLVLSLVAGGTGCDSVTDSLLEVEDPDLILPSNVNSPQGAIAVANGALGRFRSATASNDCCWLYSGLLTDEWTTSSTFVQNDEIDQRRVQLLNTGVTGSLRTVNRVRTAANQAIPLLKEWVPANTALIGEMYFIRGFAEMSLAEDYCNGIPLSNGAGEVPEFGTPQTGAEVFAVAVASFDSVLAVATGTDAQSVSIQRAARVGKARALRNLNQYSQAAALVTEALVPTSFRYSITFSTTTSDNVLWGQGFSSKRYTVADSMEGNNRDILVRNAIPFSNAKDPRLPVTDTKLNAQPTIAQDGGTIMRLTSIYDRLTAIDAVNGIDARLIEAEALLKAGDAAGWLAKLNGLRNGPNRPTTLGTVTVPSMANLADPGTPDARVSLQFREAAFWTWGRGQRLGNLRRLIRQYGRPSTAVFPEGTHFKAGTYGPDVNFPVPTDEENNPNFTGCLDRNA
jgi:starch-binding outer membrane protein, SusD/RagB family